MGQSRTVIGPRGVEIKERRHALNAAIVAFNVVVTTGWANHRRYAPLIAECKFRIADFAPTRAPFERAVRIEETTIETISLASVRNG
jgi:hypothetical protein